MEQASFFLLNLSFSLSLALGLGIPAKRFRLSPIQGRVVVPDESVALQAASISQKHKLPMADSFIYATARIYGATLWTQDDHFKGLPQVNYKEFRTVPRRGRSISRRN